jgi:hypothetical protein
MDSECALDGWGGAMDTAQMQINATQTNNMITNGVAVMSQNDSEE